MKAFGMARIGRDAEVRYSTGGEPVANISLAFSYGRKGDDGNRPTQWVEGSLWGKRAESLAPYLTKGSVVLAELEEVHTETYTGKNGEATKLVGRVSNIELTGGRPAGAAPASAPSPAPVPQAQRKAPALAIAGSGFDDMDSDIPF